MIPLEPTLLSTQALPAGTRIEEFVIERVLGSGGFGITYLARDARLNRQVVIKENLPVQFCFRDPSSLTVAPRHSHGTDAENFQWSLENFSKEAAMLASLDHPGIVRVHRSLEAFGTAYFVMPFVEGLALDELVRGRQGKPFSENELRGLLERMLDALGYLHDRGIYHRDIKPGNILITNDGIPVLIDFGSARQRLSERSMTVVESAGYTPFEQLQSRGNVGPWSDLYALGGTLVKAITSETLPKANDRVFDDPWQALTSRADLLQNHSPEFLRSIDRALALHPRDRWQDAGEWLSALVAPAVQAPQAPSVTQVTPAITPVPVAPPASRPPAPTNYRPGEERDFDLTLRTTIRMCWIAPGEFIMGSPENEQGRYKDETPHRVILTEGFWIGKYPVTQAQWEAVMGNRPSEFGKPGILKTLFGNPQHLESWENLPVESVNWFDICGNENRSGGFLGKANAGIRDGWKFDLPTEAQWEYACRAGTTGPYSGDLDEMAWYDNNSGGETHTVGQKKANAWGLHDMHGNVWEWCTDWSGAYPSGTVTDPQGPVSGMCRVVRGGSWYFSERVCVRSVYSERVCVRSAYRNYGDPRPRLDDIGFRVVLVGGGG